MQFREHKGKRYPVSPAHPAADAFPWLSEDDLQALADDIAAGGQQYRIVRLPDGRIVDGRNRELACRVAGVEPQYAVEDMDDGEALALVVSRNIRRRDLTPSQRAVIAAELANMHRGRPAKTGTGAGLEDGESDAGKTGTGAGFAKPAPVPVSQGRAAEAFDVSERSVRSAAKVRRDAPELVEAVKSGALDVKTAARVAELPEPARLQVATADEPKAAAKELLDAGGIDLDEFELDETFDGLVAGDDDEDDEPADESDAPAAPRKPLPKGFKPGNKLDPDHPFYAVLKGISTLSATITKAIAADESGRLKSYLTAVQLAKPPLLPLVRHRQLWVEGRHYDAQFVGLRALRKVILLAGKDGKPLPAAKVVAAYTKAGQDDAGEGQPT